MSQRLTQNREKILSIIHESEIPLNVMRIHKRLLESPNLSTVYRSLDYLERYEYIKSFSFGSARFFYAPDKNEHGHFLVCRECQEIIPFYECGIENLQDSLEQKYQYNITNHIIYFEGICPDCQRYLAKKAKAQQN